MLAASRELIDEAWRWKQMIGGALRQAGVLAAACLYALDHHAERLAEDHANARRLADGLAELPGIEPWPVETNIVICDAPDAPGLSRRLWQAGVQVNPLGEDRIRCVTHLDVDEAGIELALQAFREALR